mgnify:CR=1 FL=1
MARVIDWLIEGGPDAAALSGGALGSSGAMGAPRGDGGVNDRLQSRKRRLVGEDLVAEPVAVDAAAVPCAAATGTPTTGAASPRSQRASASASCAASTAKAWSTR